MLSIIFELSYVPLKDRFPLQLPAIGVRISSHGG